jgi:cytochrome P450
MSQSSKDTNGPSAPASSRQSGEKQGKRPPRHRTFSLSGCASEIQRDPLTFLLRTQQLGEVVRLRFLFSPAYLVSDPESIKHVLQQNARNYNKDVITYTMFRPFLGQGLLLNDGPSWLHQRRLIQPAFHRRHLSSYGTLMTDATVAMLEQWKSSCAKGTPVDIAEEMTRLTLQIVGRTLFSLDLNQDVGTIGSTVTTLLQLFVEYVFRPFPPLSVPTPRNRRLHQAIRSLDQVVYGLIAKRRTHLTEGDDLLSTLLAAQDEATGQGMADRQVRDEVMTLLLAGHETTANTLAWAWHLLSQSPEIEHRLHLELNEVLAGRVPTVEDVPRLKYTRMIIEETLRLYPPTPVLSRKAIDHDELRGYPIAANSMIMLSPYAVHRHPALWEEPERFDLDRFEPRTLCHTSCLCLLPLWRRTKDLYRQPLCSDGSTIAPVDHCPTLPIAQHPQPPGRTPASDNSTPSLRSADDDTRNRKGRKAAFPS